MTYDEIYDIRASNTTRQRFLDSNPLKNVSCTLQAAIFDCDKLLRQTLRLQRFLTDEGYRPCDIAACNCHSWHKRVESNG